MTRAESDECKRLVSGAKAQSESDTLEGNTEMQ